MNERRNERMKGDENQGMYENNNTNSLKKSKHGNIYNVNEGIGEDVTAALSDDDWSDGEIHEVTDILQEIGELEHTKRFTFNMTHERLKTDIRIRNASYLNEALNFAYSNIAEQNRLDYMEDRHVAIVDFFDDTINNEKCSISYFGVYDGHGGAECAEFLNCRYTMKYILINVCGMSQ